MKRDLSQTYITKYFRNNKVSRLLEPNLFCLITSYINLTEFIECFDNIYDLFSITMTCKSIYKILTAKKYLHLIVSNNLEKLTKDQLNLSLKSFKEDILRKLGLVLSGSTMLYSICSNKWGFHNNSLEKYENIFTKDNLNSLYNLSSNKLRQPDDYDLYIDPSVTTTNKIDMFEITNYLESYNIYLNYDFPDADEDIHYLITHIRNLKDKELTAKVLYEITGKNIDPMDNMEYEYSITFLKKIFNSMYRHKNAILNTYSELHDVNNQYYIKINVMRLICKNPLTGQCYKMQIIFNNEVQSLFTNYDFKFLRSYLNPSDNELSNNSFINFNQSLFSILHRNQNNKSRPYKHISSSINPDISIICQSKIKILMSTNVSPSSRKRTVQENIVEIIVTSIIRCLKYSSRGFNCMNKIKCYDGVNLPNWYICYVNAYSTTQKNNIKYFLKQIINAYEQPATASVFYIYKYGVKLYKNTILNFTSKSKSVLEAAEIEFNNYYNGGDYNEDIDLSP